MVTDYNIPEFSGLEVAQAIGHICADLPVDISSGNVSEELRAAAQRIGVRRLLHKLNTADEMCALVNDVLAGGRAAAPT